uniref:Carboxylesterase type B domain-containing protein n=1 Tax=Fusarium oxysporum (strain Fo5176) TaxID=660025 RepID=A0A0D2YHL7_FUSOF
MAFTLNHTQLGDIQGFKLDGQGVVQYLGIQYATLAHRFAAPELKANYGGTVDATNRGYRLGVAGFLDSDEMRATGIPPNRGILDQKTAFQWVRRHIGGFAGDPTRITAIGQSAGGNSALSSEDQLEALIAISPEDILSKVPLSIPLRPVVETDQMLSFGSLKTHLASLKHRPPLMIGSTDFDAVVFEILGLFADREKGSLAEGFTRSLMKSIPEEHHVRLESFISQYGISKDDSDDGTCVKILQLGTDIKYFATSEQYATFWPAQAWLYYFNESNPWEGPHKGRSAHCLDIAYLFLNYNGFMNDSQKKTATAFARDVISFTHGEAPWAEFHASKKTRVYGANGNGELHRATVGTPYEVGPSYEVQALWSRIGRDNLAQAWDAYSARS